MTAPVPGGDTRTRLAEELDRHGWEAVNRKGATTLYRCRCGHIPSDSMAMDAHRADALLPVVESIAAERAAEAERALMEEMKNRDQAIEWADRLAYAVAPVEVIGEHSSMNNPWHNALDRAASLRAASRGETGR